MDRPTYRGKKLYSDGFAYGDLFHTSDGVYIGDIISFDNPMEDSDFYVEEVNPNTVGLGLNMKDKNEKDIYEHQIVRVAISLQFDELTFIKRNVIGTVKWNSKGKKFVIEFYDSDIDFNEIDFDDIDLIDIEIVNPEENK